MNPPQVYMCSPYHPSGSSQCTSPKHPVSCIEPGLATRFIHDIIHVSIPLSQIFPPSPSLSPTESIRLIYTSVSLLLSRTQGYCYHLSKFHIYALVYCIGIFLNKLLNGGGSLVAKSYLTLATPWTVACQAPLSMEILQARILESVANSISRGSSRPKN